MDQRELETKLLDYLEATLGEEEERRLKRLLERSAEARGILREYELTRGLEASIAASKPDCSSSFSARVMERIEEEDSLESAGGWMSLLSHILPPAAAFAAGAFITLLSVSTTKAPVEIASISRQPIEVREQPALERMEIAESNPLFQIAAVPPLQDESALIRASYEGRMVLLEPGSGAVRFYLRQNSRWVEEEEKRALDSSAPLQLCLPSSDCIALDRSSPSRSSLLDDYLRFGVGSMILDPVIQRAYDTLSVRRTPFRPEISRLPRDEAVLLAYVFLLTDEATAIHLRTVENLRFAADTQSQIEAYGNYLRELADRFRAIEFPEKLSELRNMILKTLDQREQSARSRGILRPPGKSALTGDGLKSAFEDLLRAAPDEPQQNRDAILDSLTLFQSAMLP